MKYNNLIIKPVFSASVNSTGRWHIEKYLVDAVSEDNENFYCAMEYGVFYRTETLNRFSTLAECFKFIEFNS